MEGTSLLVQAAFPVTAVVGGFTTHDDASARRIEGTLRYLDPMRTTHVEIGGEAVPLTVDTTTPLAWVLQQADPPSDLEGFIQFKSVQRKRGLYLLQPYAEGRIPVILVHGLMSSPRTWLPMINDLDGDAALRQRGQFWYYF